MKKRNSFLLHMALGFANMETYSADGFRYLPWFLSMLVEGSVGGFIFSAGKGKCVAWWLINCVFRFWLKTSKLICGIIILAHSTECAYDDDPLAWIASLFHPDSAFVKWSIPLHPFTLPPFPLQLAIQIIHPFIFSKRNYYYCSCLSSPPNMDRNPSPYVSWMIT